MVTAPDEHGELEGPYITRTREEWASLWESSPVRLTGEMVRALRATQDPTEVDQIEQVYLPLTQLLNIYIAEANTLHRRSNDYLQLNHGSVPFVIGVAGSVAVGKSTTSRLLRELLAQGPGHPKVDLITTDGFLYPNAELQRRGLMNRKGFPESYDRRALLKFVMAVKSRAREVRAPVYSHLVYDIVPGEEVVVRRPDILIVEGLNVLQPPRRLSRDGSPTLAVSDFFDFSVYVDASPESLRRWYVERFMVLRRTAFRNPRSYFRRYVSLTDDEALAMASEIWDTINAPNLVENILPTRGRATVVLRKDESHDVEWIKIRKV
ncbi:type I pantothenate kinase [Nigerium massiliense]|uniref:type I pantothenate kinase n=1 Tax=Nigerium massiliense TaxID=1522317 RepID=UPI0006943905|nr:type I pantothenate kinase [Nigerium massiliense]